MMTKQMLLDNYQVSGNQLDAFKGAVEDFSDATKCITIKSAEITFLSLCNVAKYQTAGKTTFFILTGEYLDDFMNYGERLHLGSIRDEELGDEFLAELKSTTGLMLIIRGDKYLVSKAALTTLLQRACVSGDSTTKRSNLVRDLHVADALIEKNDTIKIVYREAEGVKKVFAAFSNDFALVKQSIMLSTLKNTPFCVKEYNISNLLTEIQLYVHKDTNCGKPGLILKNSDVGCSHLTIQNVLFVGDSFMILNEISMRHGKGLSKERYLERFQQALASSSAEEMLKTLEKLSQIGVRDYATFDTQSESDTEENFGIVQNLIVEGVFAIYRKILSKKAFNRVCAYLSDEIDGCKQYSYYDIAAILISIPEHLPDMNGTTIAELRKAAAEVPNYLATMST